MKYKGKYFTFVATAELGGGGGVMQMKSFISKQGALLGHQLGYQKVLFQFSSLKNFPGTSTRTPWMARAFGARPHARPLQLLLIALHNPFFISTKCLTPIY